MVRHPEFTLEQWENAPEYMGPGLSELHRRSRATILDFESLEMIAAAQEEVGAFQSNYVMGTLKAPIKLGDIPAAFVKIVSLNEDDFAIHTTYGPEILVVINGILSISIKNAGAARMVNLKPGDVVGLATEGGVRLTARGLHRQSAGLALSIMGMHPEQAQLVITHSKFSTTKEIDPIDAQVNLPYER